MPTTENKKVIPVEPPIFKLSSSHGDNKVCLHVLRASGDAVYIISGDIVEVTYIKKNHTSEIKFGTRRDSYSGTSGLGSIKIPGIEKEEHNLLCENVRTFLLGSTFVERL